MLKRIKIVTSLLLVLALFGLLQLTSGGLFFNSLKNDKENFTVLQTIRQQQSALNATWVELLQTRNTLNRAGIRWMMDQSNIGSGATVAELMQGATNTLKLTEKNWAQYEALPRDPRQSEAAFLEIKRTHSGAGGGDQQPAAEKFLAPTSDRIRHHPRHQQSHQPR